MNVRVRLTTDAGLERAVARYRPDAIVHVEYLDRGGVIVLRPTFGAGECPPTTKRAIERAARKESNR